MSKDRILQELISVSKLMQGDKGIITCTQRFPAGPTMLCNIKITRQATGTLILESLGRPKFSEGIISFMATYHQQTYWEKGHSEIIEESNTHKKFGLQADEDNLLCALDRNIVNSALNQFDSKTHEVTSDLDKCLTSDQITILLDMCTELKNSNPVKWEHILPSILLPDILQNPGEMY